MSGLGLPQIPVRFPTEEEFQYFNKYIEFLETHDQEVRQVGTVHIVPPDNFRTQHNLGTFESGFYTERLQEKDVRIMNPIRQKPTRVAKGVWKLTNVLEKQNIRALNYLDSAHRVDKVNERRLNKDKKKSTDEVYDELEEQFWNKFEAYPEPWYGADSPGTLFDEVQEEDGVLTRGQKAKLQEKALKGTWNLNKLGSILDLVQVKMSGINKPYLYFGQFKAMFALHTEDVDLHSINFIHFGHAKQWYAVPPSEKEKVIELGKKFFPNEFRNCREYFRHKEAMFDPRVLVQNGITVYQTRHYEGEFIITFAGSFHCGFNYGANCAESVNFATRNWIPLGKHAFNCSCSSETVHINMQDFEDALHTIDKAQEWGQFDKISSFLNKYHLKAPMLQKRPAEKSQDDKEPHLQRRPTKMLKTM